MTYDVDPIFGCHLFTGRLDKDGYGLMPNGKRAHRVAWERENGKAQDGLVLDHLCKERACCNVRHLELVTQQENLRRRKWGAKRDLCPFGHKLDAANTIVTRRGGKLCRRCEQGGRR